MEMGQLNGLVRFVHIVAALGLAAAFGVEAAGLVGLRQATTVDEALLWLRSRRWVLALGPPAIGLVLVTGLYLMVVSWGPAAWILVSLGSMLAIALLGGVLTGVPMARITAELERATGSVTPELRRSVRNPILMVSIATRIGITIGVVFLMVLKPALLTALLTIALGAGVGALAGMAIGRASSTQRASGDLTPVSAPRQ